jgi:hypothetical protein
VREAWAAGAGRTGIGAGTVVLDVGCGGGFCELAAARGANVPPDFESSLAPGRALHGLVHVSCGVTSVA